MDESKRQSRKAFFKETFSVFRKGLGNHVEKKILKNMDLPLRPPGALDEVEFLSTCTRCDLCVKACPHQAILKKTLRGVSAGTPYIDPDKQGCHLCDDMPCIASCEPGALTFNAIQPVVSMGKAKVNTETCLTYKETLCTACYDSCPFPEKAIRIDFDRHPEILSGCVGCGLCTKLCPAAPKAIKAFSHGYLRREYLEEQLF
ncbi:MAG: hypothetical protein CR997_11540 [Acidobacteria bacterium]|nr:MAG: hypothetical protein CR997_11540 [Acidobacteriota bacterium]